MPTVPFRRSITGLCNATLTTRLYDFTPDESEFHAYNNISLNSPNENMTKFWIGVEENGHDYIIYKDLTLGTPTFLQYNNSLIYVQRGERLFVEVTYAAGGDTFEVVLEGYFIPKEQVTL